jgi:hypothetical protein
MMGGIFSPPKSSMTAIEDWNFLFKNYAIEIVDRVGVL